MISIFYSTKKHNPSVTKKIQKSCGYKTNEILEFINDNQFSLSEAYNIALQTTKNKIVVCIHDDIHLEKNWDVKLYNYFESTDYGILGLAGTTDVSKNGIWWENRNRMVGRVQHKNKQNKWVESKYSNKFENHVCDVVCVDGLFIGIHKDRIKKSFDANFKGFHFYDIPFCISNFIEGVKIGVITDISVQHESIGVPNQQWYDNKELFCQLYDKFLPTKINVYPQVKNIIIKNLDEPKLAIIIPSKNNFEYLEQCVNSLIKTNYTNYKIYIADTGSNEETLDKIKNLLVDLNKGSKILHLSLFDFYHFSKINNLMVEYHIDKDTELLLFCNDDIKMVNDAISIMVSQYNKHKKHVGTIGCRLYYGDNSIQHGGIQMLATKDNKIGLTHKGIKSYYNASFEKEYDVLGNTGAFLMIKKDVFYNVNGFTEATLECMEDVILNLDCILQGYKNIYIGSAVCYHYESITRTKSSTKKMNENADLTKIVIPHVQKNIFKLKKYITLL